MWITTNVTFRQRFEFLCPLNRTSYHANSLGVSSISKVETLITVPLDMVILRTASPMFFNCRILSGDKLHHIIFEVCPAYKYKVEVNCMGSVGGKTPTEPNPYSFFSILRHNDNIIVLCIPCILDMSDKIRG